MFKAIMAVQLLCVVAAWGSYAASDTPLSLATACGVSTCAIITTILGTR